MIYFFMYTFNLAYCIYDILETFDLLINLTLRLKIYNNLWCVGTVHIVYYLYSSYNIFNAMIVYLILFIRIYINLIYIIIIVYRSITIK